MEHTVYLGLGSNLGDSQSNVREAVRRIEELIGVVERQSALYVTEPWGFQSDHLFANAVVRCLTSLSPRQLLRRTQQIERAMGRLKKLRQSVLDRQRHYVDRIIDIDILLYDDLTIDEPDLQIPHPLMLQRPFVMQPLAELVDVSTLSVLQQ